MPRTWKAALAPFLAGIPERTGFVGEARFGLLNDLRFGERRAAAHDRPVRRPRAARVAPQLPRDWPAAGARRPRSRDRRLARRARPAGDGRPAVALAPGAVGPSKRWPAASYAALDAPA